MLPDVSHEVVYDENAIAELLRREKNGRPLFNRLFEIYEEESARLISDLKTAFAQADAEEVEGVIHQMKGSSAAVGARKLFRITEAALSVCRAGKLSELDGLVDRIELETAAYIDKVSKFL